MIVGYACYSPPNTKMIFALLKILSEGFSIDEHTLADIDDKPFMEFLAMQFDLLAKRVVAVFTACGNALVRVNKFIEIMANKNTMKIK